MDELLGSRPGPEVLTRLLAETRDEIPCGPLAGSTKDTRDLFGRRLAQRGSRERAELADYVGGREGDVLRTGRHDSFAVGQGELHPRVEPLGIGPVVPGIDHDAESGRER